MASELVLRELPYPALPPVRPKKLEGPPPPADTPEEECCVTPKAEGSVLKPALVCPPAPRKPPPAKRKREPPAQGFYPAPRDLASLFVALPAAKKIRVG